VNHAPNHRATDFFNNLLGAGRRLQTFLSKVGEKAGDKILDAGIAALQAYVQAKLGIGG